MGNALFRLRSAVNGIPDCDRLAYFDVGVLPNGLEILCCPTAVGATVLRFDPKDPRGGETIYRLKTQVSYSEHVPRYVLYVVQGGRDQRVMVGSLEKTETHLRAKPGEFVRVQVWQVTSNSISKPQRVSSSRQNRWNPCGDDRTDRPIPSADTLTMGVTIVTQAKMQPFQLRTPGPLRFDPSTERWVQTIGVDDPNYEVAVEPLGRQRLRPCLRRDIRQMNNLVIRHRSTNGTFKEVCAAKKQRFGGVLGKQERPFLGVKINVPSEEAVEDDSDDSAIFRSVLSAHGRLLLALCLAWCEETLSEPLDLSSRFINAMRTDSGEPGSAEALDLSVQWDVDDLKKRLRHIPYAAFYRWEEPRTEPD
mmetsp:Transcript_19326/g.53062  ORF Transcript_19326/g.53062 Transcript_19326/m.53062 type:complete len:363 (-) Transcript_19326:178-1266(-)